jgi:hypothetical protein
LRDGLIATLKACMGDVRTLLHAGILQKTAMA